MKLKFRAEPKDILIFVIFSIALLYFVAIAVLNLSSFARDNTFAGLNPIPAFSKEYIGATIVGFIAALIAIFTSASSYFFDREKGIGISTESKKEKGYARWATEKELKKELKLIDPLAEKSEYAGIPLISNEKGMWVDDGEYHTLIIGSTGSGKTQMIVQPTVKILAKKGESMIITDPKGEIYENNAAELREKGYNIVLLNFRDPQKGNSWNPLSLPYSLYKSGNSDKANELLDDLAANILYDEKAQNQDPFWEKTSADYFCGLALSLFEDASESQINLNSINIMSTLGEDKFMGSTTYIQEYFKSKDPTSSAYINASSTLMAPSDTKASILSVFKQKIKLFTSRENIAEMLSKSDFDMTDIGRKKTAVFLVIHDEKKTYHSLLTIFLKQCYETLIDVAQENGGKLPYRTNFILDEFANMPPLKDVTTMVTAARSRGMRFSFIIQNFAQLSQVYGKENGDTIKGNCGNTIYLISKELSALEEISKLCGEVKSKEKDKTASTPLVTVSDLQRMKQWSAIILRDRCWPFKTTMRPNFKINWGKDYPKAPYPNREKQKIDLFDVKEFVKNKKGLNFEDFDPRAGRMTPPPINPMALFGGDSAPKNQGFNIDDLVKRIDAKIAELEAEEEAEKAKESNKEDIISEKPEILDLPKEDVDENPIKVTFNSIPNNIKEEPKESEVEENLDISDDVEQDEIKEDYDSDYITDDQFFDDFFSDDE